MFFLSFVFVNFFLFILFLIKYVFKLEILNKQFFKLCVVLGCFFSPIVFASIILFHSNSHISIYKYLEFSDYNRLVVFSICVVHLSLCVFFLVFPKQFLYELILGNLFISLSYLAVLTNHLLVFFYLLEIMTLISTVLIFSSSRSNGPIYAKNYFINHLIASSFIFFSVVLYNYVSNDFNMLNFRKFHDTNILLNICYYLFLLGIVINIGFFPFSGYIIYSYSVVSYFAYIYIFVLSNILIYILFKLFLGVEILFFISVFSACYLVMKLLFMNNILQMLTNLSLIQNSIFLGMLSFVDPDSGNVALNKNLVLYIFTSFCYKSLLHFSIVYSIMISPNTSLKKFTYSGNYMMYISFIFALLNILGLPFMSSFYIKSNIVNLVDSRLFDFFMTLGSFFIVIALPWSVILSKKFLYMEGQNKKLLPFIVLILCSILFLPLLSEKFSCFVASINYFTYVIKQLLIILLAIIFLVFVKAKNNNKDDKILSLLDDLIFFISSFNKKIQIANYSDMFRDFCSDVFLLNKKMVFFLENHSVKTSLLIFILGLEFSLLMFIT